jgi:hypothetical protein
LRLVYAGEVGQQLGELLRRGFEVESFPRSAGQSVVDGVEFALEKPDSGFPLGKYWEEMALIVTSSNAA